MKTPSCSCHRFAGLIVLLAAAMLLTQCSMPSRQAWQYVQTHGLLTYWKYEAQNVRPPFGTGLSRSSSRYAAASRNSLSVPRYAYRPSSSWSSYLGYDRMPYSYPYPQNRYYSPSPSRQEHRPAPRPRSSPPEPRPSTRIPVEEPSSPPPQIVNNDPPAPFTPVSPTPPKSSAPPASDLPYGSPVPGRVNMVNSPYAGKTQLVDVSGMGPGQTVKCPYTGKLFKVPSAQQAENKSEPRKESKIEPQNLSSEPKPEDKKP